MAAYHRTDSRIRFACGSAAILAFALGLSVRAQGPNDPSARPVQEPKAPASAIKGQEVKLPDGTYLWTGEGDRRVSLSPQDLRKLQEQIDQLKKQLESRKAVAPSSCMIHARVSKRGDHMVTVLSLTYAFRTTSPGSAIALGGRKGFLVSARLDGSSLPVLETVDDGFAALVADVGEHTLKLEVEAPITSRGTKPEVGFEIGLPRAAITTLLLDSPGPNVKRVNLTTRTPDPSQPMKPAELRRLPALDLKHLAARPGQEQGYPLGPVDSLEVTWDPPAASSQPADLVQTAELDISVLLNEGFVETTAKFKLRGPATEWKLTAPAISSVSAERTSGAADAGPIQPPAVTRPNGTTKTDWKVEFPTGSSPSDWTITAVVRQPRPKEDAKNHGPFPIGPFSVRDVLRQTGTVRVTAARNTRFVFKHGPDLRRVELPGPIEDDQSTAFFRLATGPMGAKAATAPLLTLEAIPQAGRVVVTPSYRLAWTEAGWKVRAELRITPIRTEVDAIAIEVPGVWRGLEASPAELVEGIQQAAPKSGFWNAAAEHLLGARTPVVIRLAAVHKQPFDLILTATLPTAPGMTEVLLPFPRFPDTTERDTTVSASVPDGLELRGEAREWDGKFAAVWGTPLTPATGPDGKSSKAVTTVTGHDSAGLSGVLLAWQTHRPDLAADIRAEVTVFDRQIVVQQQFRLRSPDPLPRPIRFRGPPAAVGLRMVATPSPLEHVGPGEWTLNPPADAREFVLTFNFAIPVPPRSTEEGEPGKIAVGLLWPATATRFDTTVRVWSNASTGQSLKLASPGWRELSAEPVPDRDALPALVLFSSSENAFVLDVREAAEASSVAVWVDRGLIQAWVADDGAARYRARFLVRRWLIPSLEIRLPGSIAGTQPEFLRDGLRVDSVSVPDANNGRSFRIPLGSESRPGRFAIIEVRYQLPASRAEPMELHPPTVVGASFAGPVRWQVSVSPGTVPIVAAGATPEIQWQWRGTGLSPCASGTDEELERWLREGLEPGQASDSSGLSVVARQTIPGAIAFYRIPRFAFITGCSVTVFFVCLILLRLPYPVLGPTIAVAAGGVGVAAIYFPHVVAQIAAATQPGLLAVLAVVGIQFGIRWSYRHRITHLPGFSRGVPEATAPQPPVPGPSTSRNRPVSVGSSGSSPLSPAGG